MAIDPTTPVSPILPTPSAGIPPDSSAVLTALARQALANTTAQLGNLAGQAAVPVQNAKGKVEQAGQAATQDTEHAADAPSPKFSAPTGAAPAARSPPEARLAQAIRLATAEAVPRQAGIAPLMADLRAVLLQPDTPAEVRDASRALLAATPTISDITTGAGLRRAVERSGVLLEARLAKSPSSSVDAPARIPVADGDLKAALLVFRGALSAWLGRIENAPAGLVIGTVQDPVSSGAEADGATMREAPAGRATADREGMSLGSSGRGQATPSTPALRSLSAPSPSSGAMSSPPSQPRALAIPQNAQAMDLPSGSPPPTESSAPNTQTSSSARQQAPNLQNRPESASAELEARFGAFVAPMRSGPERSSSPAAPSKATLPSLIQVEHLGEEASAGDPMPARERPLTTRAYAPSVFEDRAKTPPPPYAGGPMAGQKPAEAPVTLGATPEDMARSLLKKAHAAIARQDLMQIASLPESAPQDREQADTRAPGATSAKLNLDLPFVTPQGVAVAQFEISRDGGGSGGGATSAGERTYKARFSIDPLGPVHALVTLTGARARVSLWAERAETISRLRAGEEALGAALRQAELSPEVAVHSGAPLAQSANPLGHFVDQAS